MITPKLEKLLWLGKTRLGKKKKRKKNNTGYENVWSCLRVVRDGAASGLYRAAFPRPFTRSAPKCRELLLSTPTRCIFKSSAGASGVRFVAASKLQWCGKVRSPLRKHLSSPRICKCFKAHLIFEVLRKKILSGVRPTIHVWRTLRYCPDYCNLLF